MKTTSGQLVLSKKETKSIHAIRAFALDRFDFKRNKKGDLIPKAREMSLAIDVLEDLLTITK